MALAIVAGETAGTGRACPIAGATAAVEDAFTFMEKAFYEGWIACEALESM
jgi:hypothetical protein